MKLKDCPSVGVLPATLPGPTIERGPAGPYVAVREVTFRYGSRKKSLVLDSPGAVVDLIRRIIDVGADREHFAAVYLDSRNQPLGWQMVSVGCATASLVHPREIYRPAILLGATAVVVAHNHPSGDPEPSNEDDAVTRRLAESGTLLGIALLDHVIVGADAYHSYREMRPDVLETSGTSTLQRASVVRSPSPVLNPA